MDTARGPAVHEKKSQFDCGSSDLWKFHSLNMISMYHLFWPLDWQVRSSACSTIKQRYVRVAVRLVSKQANAMLTFRTLPCWFKVLGSLRRPYLHRSFFDELFLDFRFPCLRWVLNFSLFCGFSVSAWLPRFSRIFGPGPMLHLYRSAAL